MIRHDFWFCGEWAKANRTSTVISSIPLESVCGAHSDCGIMNWIIFSVSSLFMSTTLFVNTSPGRGWKKAFSESLNVLYHWCAAVFCGGANKSHSMGLFYTKSDPLSCNHSARFFSLSESWKSFICLCVFQLHSLDISIGSSLKTS